MLLAGPEADYRKRARGLERDGTGNGNIQVAKHLAIILTPSQREGEKEKNSTPAHWLMRKQKKQL